MTVITITEADARRYMAEAVAERGDLYVYQPNRGGWGCTYCKYNDDDEAVAPDCLIGTILHKAGLPLAELSSHEGETAARFFGYNVPMNGPVHRNGQQPMVQATQRVVTALQRAQWAQDNGETWSEAATKFTAALDTLEVVDALPTRPKDAVLTPAWTAGGTAPATTT